MKIMLKTMIPCSGLTILLSFLNGNLFYLLTLICNSQFESDHSYMAIHDVLLEFFLEYLAHCSSYYYSKIKFHYIIFYEGEIKFT